MLGVFMIYLVAASSVGLHVLVRAGVDSLGYQTTLDFSYSLQPLAIRVIYNSKTTMTKLASGIFLTIVRQCRNESHQTNTHSLVPSLYRSIEQHLVVSQPAIDPSASAAAATIEQPSF